MLKTKDPVLLHCCCAPCAGGILERLVEAGTKVTVFFYNPNIHPRGEYELRKDQLIKFCQKKHISFIDADYDAENWFDMMRGKEHLPERSERCSLCFDMRLTKTADYAAKNGFSLIATTLSVSRWKDAMQVNLSGKKAEVPGVTFWDYDWRQNNGEQLSSMVAKKEGFYRQEYCGCLFSLREANEARRDKGKEIIVRDV
ncbi:MAG: epoxyqueuosine reductase QueH [Candidatus Omnitrophica bacterium]|nr:epoxyqueuosine reductase QueH [Candidatus Omnitrophota bacterium]